MTPLEVLAAHRAEYDNRTYHLTCQCGLRWPALREDYEAEIAGHAAHVLDALTNAGHSIVELPEPAGFVGGFPDLPDFDTGADGSVCITEEKGGRRVVWHANTEIHDPRRLASALLAAAAAETGGKA